MTTFAATEAYDFSLKSNGEAVALNYHSHILSDGEAFLSLRHLVEAMGGGVYYDYNEGIITLRMGQKEAKLTLGEGVATTTDGSEITVVNFGGRTHVSASFIEDFLDVTIHIDNENRSLLIADNANLDTIVRLMAEDDAANIPSMSADMKSIIKMTVTVDNETENVDMEVVGTINIDYANRFQHIHMTTSFMGMDIVSEIFDNGESMYVVAEDMVLILPSSSFDMADDLAAQFSPISGLELDRRYFAGLRLVTSADTYTVSGVMNIPEEFFSDILAGMGDVGSMLPGFDEIPGMDMSITLNAPIAFTSVFDRSSELMTSMDVTYDMTVTITALGETSVVHMMYTMSMPRIEYNTSFSTVVPAEIVEAAVDMLSLFAF